MPFDKNRSLQTYKLSFYNSFFLLSDYCVFLKSSNKPTRRFWVIGNKLLSDLNYHARWKKKLKF